MNYEGDMKYIVTALVIIFASTACMDKAAEETPVSVVQQDCSDITSDIFSSELCKPDNLTSGSVLAPQQSSHN